MEHNLLDLYYLENDPVNLNNLELAYFDIDSFKPFEFL